MESLSVGVLQNRTPSGAEFAYLHAKGALRKGQESRAPLLRNR
jgi:hypothetical protein